MPSSFKVRTRAFWSKFFPVQHVARAPIHSNVHDLSRIGGVSVLTLPPDYAPYDLVIATRFAATGQYLINHGLAINADKLIWKDVSRDTSNGVHLEEHFFMKSSDFNVPGLFRVPGSKVTVEKLRAYFERQMHDGHASLDNFHRNSSEIDFTVRLAALPNQNVLIYGIHDIASCFKSFLADLDGGLLGSIAIFDGLRKVALPPRTPRNSSSSADLEWRCVGLRPSSCSPPPPKTRLDPIADARNIARILLSIPCAARRNLVLAVFGILALFAAPDITPPRANREPLLHLEDMRDCCVLQESRMTADSLGRIFAPLLLGPELTRQVRLEQGGGGCSPRKRRLGKRRSVASFKTSVTVNVNGGGGGGGGAGSRLGELQEEQARILVVARVISFVVEVWEVVCHAIRQE